MICPKCHQDQPDGNLECIRCGIIFVKYMAHVKARAEAAATESPEIVTEEASGAPVVGWLKTLAFPVGPGVNPIVFAGRVVAYIVFLVWGWVFILTPMGSEYLWNSFMHSINLPFHEAGHIIFRPFGRFLSVLGGSLGQLLIPAVCLGTFLMKTRDAFGASIALWWLGQNFIDLAPYINDARAGQLMLLGGVTGREVEDYHDWEMILRSLGWMQHDHIIARLSSALGTILMATAFAWGGSILYLQFKNLDRG